MLDQKARSFIAIMVVIALLSLGLRIAIEKIIKITISQNESSAEATLKLISAALENYAKDHLGEYPENFSALTRDDSAYLDRDYILRSPRRGYSYNCMRLESSGYDCSAIADRCGFTGKKNYSVKTGGLLESEDCSKKD